MASSSVIGVLKALLTADTAQFDAAMGKSAATAQKTAKGIHTISDEIAKLTPQAERMAKAFAGDKLLYSANSMVQAVAKIGGATKLTIAEQAKVNAKLTEAINKYKVLGQQAPAAMMALHKATLGAVAPTQTLTTRTVALAAAFGSFVANLATNAIYAAGRAIFAMARNAFDSAGQLLDLSSKTGLTTDTLQRMSYVAKQTGTDLEAMTRASFQLGIRIASGGKQVREAADELKRYGVQWEVLRTQTADQQWDTVIDALSKVENTTERNRLGVALMGKTYAEVSAAVAQNYKDMADAASLSSRAQLEALDRAGDAWDGFVENTTNKIRGFLGTLVLLAQAIKEAREDPTGPSSRERLELGLVGARKKNIELTEQLTTTTASYVQQLAAMRAEIALLTPAQKSEIAAAQKLGEDLSVLEDKYGLTTGALKLYTSEIKTATDSTKKWSLGFATITAALKEMQLRMLRLTDAQKAEIAAGKELGLSTEQIASTMKIATQVVDLYADSLKDAADFTKRLAVETTDLSQINIGRGLMEAEQARQDARAKGNEDLLDASRDAAKVEQQISTRRAEHDIEMAKRAGASWQALYQMERALSEANLQAAIADTDREFEERAKAIDRSTDAGAAAYEELQRVHARTVDQMVEDWQLGQDEQLDALKRAHDKMRAFGDETAAAISDGFADMLTGVQTFRDGMVGIWRSIQQSVSKILSEMLNNFLHTFLAGMVRGISSAKLGESLGSSLMGGLPGAGLLSGGKGIAGAALGAGGLFGGGTGAAAGVAGVESAIGGGAAAGGGLLGTIGALATNPFTLAIAGGIGAFFGLKKLLGGGSKANDIRDKDLSQFATFDTKRDGTNPPGFYGLDAFLSKYKKHDLFAKFIQAKKPGDVRAAWKPIVEFTATKGRDLKSFAMGGFVPPGAVVPAILHGGSFGEDIKPRTAPAGGSSAVHMTWHVHAIDAKGISDLVKSDAFKRTLSREIQLDGPLRVGHRRALVGY